MVQEEYIFNVKVKFLHDYFVKDVKCNWTFTPSDPYLQNKIQNNSLIL